MDEIDQGAQKFFPGEEWDSSITTGGMGPCTGVIIYDPISKGSFATHLTAPHTHEESTLDEMLSDALERFGNNPGLKIYVGGCCDDGKIDGASAQDVRNFVERKILTYFPGARLNLNWPPKGVVGMSMTLDQNSGEFWSTKEST